MRRVICVLGGCDTAVSGCDILAEDCTVEDAIGGFGLVGGDFVARLKDAGEGEVAALADEAAAVGGVGLDGSVAGGVKGGAARVGNLE